MLTDLKIGDVVQLRSGGPRMTVTSVFPGENVVDGIGVAWFIGDQLIGEAFDAKCLEKVEKVEPQS